MSRWRDYVEAWAKARPAGLAPTAALLIRPGSESLLRTGCMQAMAPPHLIINAQKVAWAQPICTRFIWASQQQLLDHWKTFCIHLHGVDLLMHKSRFDCDIVSLRVTEARNLRAEWARSIDSSATTATSKAAGKLRSAAGLHITRPPRCAAAGKRCRRPPSILDFVFTQEQLCDSSAPPLRAAAHRVLKPK